MEGSERLKKICEYYWYTGILKGVQVLKERPGDYSKIVKQVQEKAANVEKVLNDTYETNIGEEDVTVKSN